VAFVSQKTNLVTLKGRLTRRCAICLW